MAIDWGEAVRIGLMGFGMVFLVLVILAVAIWLSGLVLRRMDGSKDKTAVAKTNDAVKNSKEGA
jgi:Na+-transporting methylmalonyl-CoA/oxaloacetate decarboxylase gamma subunit